MNLEQIPFFKVLVAIEAEFYVDYHIKSLPPEPLRVFTEMSLIEGGYETKTG